MELDRFERQGIDPLHLPKKHFVVFAGQPQNEMGPDVQPPCGARRNSLPGRREVMAATDGPQCFVAGGFDAVFDRHIVFRASSASKSSFSSSTQSGRVPITSPEIRG